MKRGKALAIGAALIALLCTCGAETLAYQRDATGPSQAKMNETARKSYEKADRALNRAYERLARALEPGPRAKLKTAELAWLRVRDAESDFRASEFKGATLEPAARWGYLEDLTRRRTRGLNDAYKQFAGD